jgi:hypothetical protein
MDSGGGSERERSMFNSVVQKDSLTRRINDTTNHCQTLPIRKVKEICPLTLGSGSYSALSIIFECNDWNHSKLIDALILSTQLKMMNWYASFISPLSPTFLRNAEYCVNWSVTRDSLWLCCYWPLKIFQLRTFSLYLVLSMSVLVGGVYTSSVLISLTSNVTVVLRFSPGSLPIPSFSGTSSAAPCL